VDIAGAKALKRRLGQEAADEARPAAADVDIPEDAPPVYHWLGVAWEAPRDAEDDRPPTADVSLFRRIGFSVR
jgi:hypothetical protein